MLEIKRILVPTDFSPQAQEALHYACSLAEKFQAEMHILHVVQDLIPLVGEPGAIIPPTGDYFREIRAGAERALQSLPTPDCDKVRNVVRILRDGPPFLEIIRYAKEAGTDLIVMGTHGRSGLAHVLLGSVTEKIIRKAPCAVLTVRPRDHKFEMP